MLGLQKNASHKEFIFSLVRSHVKIYTELIELIPATAVCYMYSRWGQKCVNMISARGEKKGKKKKLPIFMSAFPPETLRSLISTLGRPLH